MKKKQQNNLSFDFLLSMLGSLIYAISNTQVDFAKAIQSFELTVPAFILGIGTFFSLGKMKEWENAKSDDDKLKVIKDLLLPRLRLVKESQHNLEEEFVLKDFDNDQDHKIFTERINILCQEVIQIQQILKDKGMTREAIQKILDERIKSNEQFHQLFPIHNIPYLSLGNLFKGREDDFNKLVENIEKESQVTAITQDKDISIKAIHGLGGIGKTRLAIEYGWYALENGYYKAVLFVNCSQQLTDGEINASETAKQIRRKSAIERLYVEMAKLAAADLLDISGCDKLEPQQAFQQIIKELHSRKDWLVVFDNVDDFEMCNAIEQILPLLKNGRVIITSRLSNWTGNIKPLLIEKLSIDASIEYLLLKTKDKRPVCDNDEEKVRELAEKLDGLPVALEQAAAYICYNTLTFEQYLKDFEEV